MTKRKKKTKQMKIKEQRKKKIYTYIYIYKLLFMIRGILSAYSKRRELKNLGPWKLMENSLILVLHCGK